MKNRIKNKIQMIKETEADISVLRDRINSKRYKGLPLLEVSLIEECISYKKRLKEGLKKDLKF